MGISFIEILKVIVLGIVEGFTEWLPISSTGHMILVDEIISMNQPKEYMDVFMVVIQLGAILAVVSVFWKQLWPFTKKKGEIIVSQARLQLWIKIIVGCIPAAVIGLFANDYIESKLSGSVVVAVMLILYGIAFIWLERQNKNRRFPIERTSQIDLRTALLIGLFQCLAMIPGTSRSGATILGAMILGVGRTAAAEYSFFLSVPVMFGASLLRILKHGIMYNFAQIFYMILGMAVAYILSVYSIRFLMGYIKRHSFTIFGYYRIILGIIVLIYTGISMLAG